MKFSVVIPCHDRLDLLKEAIHTVLNQDWTDWELIVFDNASKERIADYVKGLENPRILYNRSEEFLPVSDSWNRAIDMATGDYTILLGNDDGLTPNYFSRLAPIIHQFNCPEILYSAIYQFMHPGVAPWAPEGYVAEVKNGFFFKDKVKPFLLSHKQACKAVKGSVRLRRNFTFNIQAFVFSQTFIKRLKQNGPIFQSPFPDYYIANVAFAEAKSAVVIPEPMTIVGTSKTSVGYTVFNGLEDRFAEILNTKLTQDPIYPKIEQLLLPGLLYNTNYVLTMEHVLRNINLLPKPKTDFNFYRRIQIYSKLYTIEAINKNKSNLPFWKHLRFGEKIWTYLIFNLIKLNKRTKIFSKFINFYLQHRATSVAFRAQVRICHKTHYNELIKLFDDLYTGSLK